MKICVYGASSNEIDRRYLDAGMLLGAAMAKRGHELVFGGGNTGLMGAVARGVHQEGGRVIGIAPRFFRVDGVLYPDCDEWIYTDTMRSRKEKMEQVSDAFLVTPGGIGTLDEFFEIFTLRQLDRHHKPIALLNTGGYFDPISQMLESMAKERFLVESCLDLIKITPDPEEILDFVEQNPAGSLSGSVLKFLEDEV
ncbi:MAG: TIGR00730 family Rossman fold protein [Ruminococcaceae bacterium]|nr:TIGR00730 family Rossman fold protein [Oscillospiraceae bacterium]